MISSTSDRPIAILSACGSRGDVNPITAIASVLVQLGYECHVSVAEPYADVVAAAGANPNVVIDRQSFDQVVSDPTFWRPLAGGRKVLAEVAEKFFDPHLKCIRQRYVPGRTVLVAHPLDFASRVFREIEPSCPLSSVHLAPAMLRHPVTPPRLLPDHGWTRCVLPDGWPRLNRLTYLLGDALFLDRILGPSINRVRAELAGLPKQRRLMNEWCHSPDQVLALYPSGFAPELAQRYASDRFHFVGFPRNDGIDEKTCHEPLPTNRPLLVTTGSAHHGDDRFLSRVVALCERESVPVVWCCPSNPEPVCDSDNVRTVGYIPLGQWLPHCRAIIHHGGIGTTSRAIQAGVPQIIRALAFDQFDNAQRVERLNQGLWLRHDRDLNSRMLAELFASFRPIQNDTANASEIAARHIDELRKSRD
ncbi:rhamnosyltransferase subunit B [Neorhodopirellula lusitana]|uniref:Rhamnosyltransferase subunit B n=1 Tax=Neorhodopirellula lusitana TaxID=445327 RepID=A0ABY1PTI8_9BACT|nr:nucleotide disphospho-sugar-binding domain-containing protein [Neorhodopirellula lusitana]SMP47188.1 rhamnosyltransferase subunit B [Neorhodopirellula lusitana]